MHGFGLDRGQQLTGQLTIAHLHVDSPFEPGYGHPYPCMMRSGCPHLFIFPLNYVIYNKYLYSPKKKKHYQQWRSRLVPKMGRKGYIRTLWFTLRLQKGPLINVVGNIYIIVQWGPAHTLITIAICTHIISITQHSLHSHTPPIISPPSSSKFSILFSFFGKKIIIRS